MRRFDYILKREVAWCAEKKGSSLTQFRCGETGERKSIEPYFLSILVRLCFLSDFVAVFSFILIWNVLSSYKKKRKVVLVCWFRFGFGCSLPHVDPNGPYELKSASWMRVCVRCACAMCVLCLHFTYWVCVICCIYLSSGKKVGKNARAEKYININKQFFERISSTPKMVTYVIGKSKCDERMKVNTWKSSAFSFSNALWVSTDFC